MAVTTLTDQLTECRVVVVAGTGGVGKTTTAAALAMAIAHRGSRVCVLTVDPARRLASALGLDLRGGSATMVTGPWTGTLTAVQLDAGHTFDGLLERYGSSPDVVASIRTNPIYRSLAGALGGTQEYMAVERVYELSSSGLYDVVVIDTPPARNAVDLLDAPQRLLNFLTHPIVRTLLVPTRFSLRAASFATAAATRTIGTVVGTELVSDVVSFFQAFSSLHAGFVERARSVNELLHSTTTGYVLVTTPRGDALEESRWFSDQLRARHVDARGIVVNRIHPSFTSLDPERLPLEEGTLGAHLDNLRRTERAARRDRASVSVLTGTTPDVTIAEIPWQSTPLTDVPSLNNVALSYL
jgi:anion-transporting  ArsA/GET3 family ATPase